MKFSRRKLILSSITVIILAVVVLVYFLLNPHPLLITTPDGYVIFCEKDTQCHETNLPYQNSTLSFDQRLDDLIGRMTNAEKIGQMALVEKKNVSDLNDIAKYGLGALLSGGGSNPVNNSPEGWLEMTKNFQSYSQKTRLSIPLLYGVDANHGHGNVIGATIFPHSIGLAASKDVNLVREVAKATAEEVASTGVNWILSPDLDVVRDIRWGRVYETFGTDYKLAGILGQAYIEGLQSINQSGMKIAATAKHYVGNGATRWGTSVNKDYSIDQGVSNISESELRQVDIHPFKLAIDADVKSVMIGLNIWNGQKVSSNKHLLVDVLRGELGFKGFTVSDWYGVYSQESNKYTATVRDINAGTDMVMLPFDYKEFHADMQRAILNGDISQSRLDEAVRRILKVKFEIGLFDNVQDNESNLEKVGSDLNRELARKAVRQSLVLLKNDNVLPVSKNIDKILVAGSAADNIGKQSGGWTVEWQGIDGNWIEGTSILKGIKNITSSTANIEYDLNGEFKNQKGRAELGIAVVGEKPYSEGVGDNENLQLSSDDLKTIENLKKKSKKLIVIIISGRPLNIKEHAKNWDAVIAAWLPGSEGQGVADVLFGDYLFTGTLPLDWDL